MLWLKRITRFNEVVRCSITKKQMAYGDYYYEDDTDGLIVSFDYYQARKKQMRNQKFTEEVINKLQDQRSYQLAMEQAQRAFLEETLFDRKVSNKEVGY